MAIIICGPNLANMLLGKSIENCSPGLLTQKFDNEPELKHDNEVCSKNSTNNSREIKGAKTENPKRKEVLTCLKDQWNTFANTLNKHSSSLSGENYTSQVQDEKLILPMFEISKELNTISTWLYTQVKGRKRIKIPENKKEKNNASTPTVPLKSNEKPDKGNSKEKSVSESIVEEKGTTPNSPKVPKK